MKKYLKVIYILIIIFICINSINISFAETKYTMQDVSYTYKGNDVKIRLNGETVNTDIPPIIHEGRTLIPIRALIESLGGTVNWYQEIKRVSISLEETNISMVINNNIAKVNDKEMVLDVPPCIAYDSSNPNAGRTVVPIRFVMESLGLEVEWDQNTFAVDINSKQPDINEEDNNELNSIEGILTELIDDKIQINIKTKEKMKYTILDLKDPYRTVIDIENSSYPNTQNIIVEKGNVDKIRLGQKENDFRIVIDLFNFDEYELQTSRDGKEIVILYEMPKSSIADIKLFTKNDESVLEILGSGLSKYDIRRLTNPERICLELYNISTIEKDAIINDNIKNNEYISKIISEKKNNNQFNITIYIKDQYQYSFSKTDSKGLINIYKEEYKNIEYSNDNEYKFIAVLKKSIYIEDIEYTQYRAENKFEVVIDNKYIDIGKGDFKIGDEYLERINISKGQTKTTITFKDYKACDYIVDIKEKSLNINIVKRSFSDKIVIVIDPGHIGHNGIGAAYEGTIERDINLNVANKLINLLEELKNVEVYSSIDLDYVTLYEITDYANNIGADLFVSIHCNAAESTDGEPLTTVKGTETYYPTRSSDNNYGITSKKLAEFIQSNLIEQLDSVNRGIKERNTLAVLRTSQMPAVLTELGFMSSPEELKLLNTEEYRKNCASAIYEGIVDAIEYMKN